jgi:hypothetical protein
MKEGRMAYDKDQLALMAHGRNRKQYAYYTTDAPAAVDTAGYFNAAADMLDIGDVMLVVQVNDVGSIGSVTAAGWHIVVSNDGTVVDVSDATAITTTDTD